MSEKLPIHSQNEQCERPVLGNPLTPEILEKVRRLFYELPPNAVSYCDVVTRDGDRRRIEHHPTSKTGFILAGPYFQNEIDLADPGSYSGLFILDGTLAHITQDSTDEGLVRLKQNHDFNEFLRFTVA